MHSRSEWKRRYGQYSAFASSAATKNRTRAQAVIQDQGSARQGDASAAVLRNQPVDEEESVGASSGSSVLEFFKCLLGFSPKVPAASIEMEYSLNPEAIGNDQGIQFLDGIEFLLHQGLHGTLFPLGAQMGIGIDEEGIPPYQRIGIGTDKIEMERRVSEDIFREYLAPCIKPKLC